MVVISLLALGFPGTSWGLQSSYDSIHTSDNLRLWGFGFAQKMDPYEVGFDSQQLKFDERTRRIHSLNGSYHLSVSPSHRLKFSYSLLNLDSETRHRLRGLGSAVYEAQAEKLMSRFRLQQRLPSQTLSILMADHFDLKEDQASLQIIFRPYEKLKLQGSGELGWRSDSNTKFSSDFALLYGVSPDWPWIWVGYGYYTLSFQKQNAAYWSPKNFTSHGLRVDMSFPVVSQLSGIFAVNFNNYDEDGFTGRGHYGVVGLQWGSTSDFHFKMTWTQIRSGQSSSPWKYDGITLNLFMPDLF